MNLIYKIRGAKTQNELYEVIFFFNIFRAGSFSLNVNKKKKLNKGQIMHVLNKLSKVIQS